MSGIERASETDDRRYPRTPGPATGIVFNVQRFSVHDGPGIRTTVFLKGCPLSCAWCHNPEGLERCQEIRITPSRCCDCGLCREICPSPDPAEPLAVGSRSMPGRQQCNMCGRCVEVCPTGAREQAGQEMSSEQLLTAVLRDRIFFDESGGGVTFSGGEPLAQAGFLLDCLARFRSAGLSVAVDTSGAAAKQTMIEVARSADLLLFDIKTTDPRQHERFVGMPLEPILENLRVADQLGARLWLRLPIVPGVNDRPGDLRRISSLAAGLRNVELLCLLPYHESGAPKQASMSRDRDWQTRQLEAPSDERMSALATQLAHPGLRVVVGG